MLVHTCHVADDARRRYREFIALCRAEEGGFRLTPRAEPTPYALCFAIFGLQLLQDRAELDRHRDSWDRLLRDGLRRARETRRAVASLERDKPYLQLLTFTLSALAVLGTLDADPLREEVCELLPQDLARSLELSGVLRGVPTSGNHAMFLAILLLHAAERLGMDTRAQLQQWVSLHLTAMNRFGFWGSAESMSHLQFQNGYHQYEILEYLHSPNVPWQVASASVATLADAQGHFAPYIGGGGCYDYDAVFLLTATADVHSALLATTHATISSEQNADGGFCESHYVRPRSWPNFRRTLQHIAAGRGRARMERIRWGAALMRPRHDRVHTHWSRYSRGWSESNLWDSWFRMLALARIEVAFDPARARRWGFIGYPGIGFHPSIRDTAGPK